MLHLDCKFAIRKRPPFGDLFRQSERSELLGTLFLLRINCPKSKAVEKPLHDGITIMQGLNEFMVVA